MIHQFPAPSPRPSFEAGVNKAHLVPSGVEDFTLRQLGRRLESVLVQAGYRQVRYLGYRCSGFALIADLERIEADATPFEGAARFGPPPESDRFAEEELTQRLSFAANGTYRQLVLLVEDNPTKEPKTLPTVSDLQVRVATGQSSLPFGFDDVLFSADHAVKVLIYEYEKGPEDKQVRLIDRFDGPGGPRHLTRSGLYRALRSPPQVELPIRGVQADDDYR